MRIPLTQGCYTSKSLIAEAQRCLNLFPEVDPSDAPFPTTHYLTPGLTSLAVPPVGGASRLEWVASNGRFYRVVGPNVYAVASSWAHTKIGSIGDGTTPCSMDDNGLVAILVDGSANGYAIQLSDNSFAAISSPAFYGADAVRFLDTFFVFNRPNTNQWYLSLSEMDFANFTATNLEGDITNAGSGYANGVHSPVSLIGGSGSGATAQITVAGGAVTDVTMLDRGIDYAIGDVLTANNSQLGGTGNNFAFTLTVAGAFNSLDIAATETVAGNNLTLAITRKNVWLAKANGIEVWFDAGNSDFAFSEVPGVFIEHGLAAKYSLCVYDGALYWLGRDRAGTAIVFRTEGYEPKRISTHCIENILNQFTDITDAVGLIYQQDGHTFYQLSFPTDDQTWVYDLATNLWHERASIDSDGQEHRARPQLAASVNNAIVVGDWQTGTLYSYDLNNQTEDGNPIVRRRGFPHIVEDGARVSYRQFIAAMDVGLTPDIMASDEPQIFLRWSDSGGNGWGSPISTGMGATGQVKRSIQFQRLGMGRDRVFELFWSAPVVTALNGAFCDFSRSRT